jgi:predicted nucleic acid-binding protein
MTISIDTNVIAALWDDTDALNAAAVKGLGSLLKARAKLVVPGPVYAELMAGPLRTGEAMDLFFEDTGIQVDWTMEEGIWREAGRAYREYVQRRKRSGGGTSRRILPDFLIGAHALVRDYSLLTLDGEHYKVAFPEICLLSL